MFFGSFYLPWARLCITVFLRVLAKLRAMVIYTRISVFQVQYLWLYNKRSIYFCIFKIKFFNFNIITRDLFLIYIPKLISIPFSAWSEHFEVFDGVADHALLDRQTDRCYLIILVILDKKELAKDDEFLSPPKKWARSLFFPLLWAISICIPFWRPFWLKVICISCFFVASIVLTFSVFHRSVPDKHQLHTSTRWNYMLQDVPIPRYQVSAIRSFFFLPLCIFSQVRNITERIILISTTGLRWRDYTHTNI